MGKFKVTADGPTRSPSSAPSIAPSLDPSTIPSTAPSLDPSTVPSFAPSLDPSLDPSTEPSLDPSFAPSLDPSTVPSFAPSLDPSTIPSSEPSLHPSTEPSMDPSTAPSLDPSSTPNTTPNTSICSDDTTWRFGTKNCAWVQSKPSKQRCSKESVGGVPASDACPVACGDLRTKQCTIPECDQRGRWTNNAGTKNCDLFLNNPTKYGTKCKAIGWYRSGQRMFAYEACNQCGKCILP